MKTAKQPTKQPTNINGLIKLAEDALRESQRAERHTLICLIISLAMIAAFILIVSIAGNSE